jgi:hypothetical protein
MKKSIKQTILSSVLFASVCALGLTACKKELDGSPDYKAGNPTGTITPGEAPGGTVLTVTGSGLGQMRSIVFEKNNVPANLQPNLNTETAIVFRVPDTAFGGQQNIVFTNVEGRTLSIPFKVIALPSVSGVSNYNYHGDGNVTLTGNNLDDVTAVVFDGTTVAPTIVSQSRKELVLKMPTGTLTDGKLKITNASGTVVTTQSFVNLDNAYHIFTEGYGDGWADGSWEPASVSSTVAKTGTKSFAAAYPAGGWKAEGFANWWPSLDYSADFKYLSFWVKGGTKDLTLYLTANTRGSGFANNDQSVPIEVPKNEWTYFKLPLSTLDLWKGGTTQLKQLGFWTKGPDGGNETIHFDDVILIK